MSPRERQPIPPPVEDPSKEKATPADTEADFSDRKELYRKRIEAALERVDKEDLDVEIKRLEDELGIKIEDTEVKK